MDTVLHPVKWDQLKQFQDRDFCTDTHHKITVMKETIPIVFVPGIMGSRLKGAGNEVVWDPSNPMTYMVPNYGRIKPADRKRKLINPSVDVLRWGDNAAADLDFCDDLASISGVVPFSSWDWLPPDFHPNYTAAMGYDSSGSMAHGALQDFTRQQLGPLLGKQGWSEVSYPDYLPVMAALSAVDTIGGFASYFYCPVYGFGYNFLNDNRLSGNKLANRIFDIIQMEGSKPQRYCKKVILVSHSMGGLVVRAALHYDGAGPHVLGVLHGAQPVSGAPAAYRRMRAGTEYGYYNPKGRTGADVLGKHAKDIVPILANCVGGLELLPTSAYKDHAGNAQWLFELDGYNQPIVPPEPTSNNPYHDIYVDQDDKNFLRLLYNPSLLTPEGMDEYNKNSAAQQSSGQSQGPHKVTKAGEANNTPVSDFVANVTQAYNFQLEVTPDVKHPNTYQGYSVGNDTFEHVTFKIASDQSKKGEKRSGEGTDWNPNVGKATGGTLFTLEDPDPKAGDGTVPQSSALALNITDPLRTYKIKDVGHQDFFSDPTSLANSSTCIQRMLDGYKKAHGC